MSAAPALMVFAVDGIPEVVPGDDLSLLIGDALDGARSARVGFPGIGFGGIGLEDGDILAVTSKIVSKAEGRIIAADDREQAITDETVRVVASREHPGGVTRIVESRLGIVGAAAGVDASNTAHGTVLLLPLDPDASAARLRSDLSARFGVELGVIITDTLGRAWREGQIDVTIGASGVRVLDDLRGSADTQGRRLDVTVPAVGDEIASAADLVKRKSTGTPVAVVRGLAHLLDGAAPGARVLNRPSATDMFRLGTEEAIAEGYASGYADGFAEGQREGASDD